MAWANMVMVTDLERSVFQAMVRAACKSYG